MSWGIADTAPEIEKIKAESVDYLNGLNSCGVIDYGTYSYAFDFYADLIDKAYSLGKKESEWTLCSKRMPEEHEWIGTKRFGTTISDKVYVTFEAPDGQRFTDHISFQNGKLSASDAERMRVWYKGAKPIAWMPLPEAFKGEQNGGD